MWTKVFGAEWGSTPIFLGGRCPPKGGMGRFLNPLYPPFEGGVSAEDNVPRKTIAKNKKPSI